MSLPKASRFSDVIEPSLTTIQQPTYEMGQTAANVILQEIESNIKILQTLTLVLSHLKKYNYYSFSLAQN